MSTTGQPSYRDKSQHPAIVLGTSSFGTELSENSIFHRSIQPDFMTYTNYKRKNRTPKLHLTFDDHRVVCPHRVGFTYSYWVQTHKQDQRGMAREEALSASPVRHRDTYLRVLFEMTSITVNFPRSHSFFLVAIHDSFDIPLRALHIFL